MIREVYINGNLVDSKEDDAPSLFFDSPIFSDISKIKSNGTSTYKLPLTERNKRLFEQSQEHDVINLFPYIEHRIDEFRNGIPIIQNGRMILLNITQTDFEFAVYWGIKSSLQDLLDINLRDLSKPDYLIWNNRFTYLEADSQADYGFIYADFGQGADITTGDNEEQTNGYKKSYVHPSVNVEYVIQAIQDQIGIPFEYSEERRTQFKNTWIPLLSKNANQITWDDANASFSFWGTASVDKTALLERISDRLGLLSGYVPSGLGGPIGVHRFEVKGVAKLINSGGTSIKVGISQRFNPFKYPISVQEFSIDPETNSADIDFSFEYEFGDANFVFVYFRYVTPKGERELRFGTDSNPDADLSDVIGKITYIDDEVKYLDGTNYHQETPTSYPGMRYPICANLPDMSYIEFLKSILQMYGLFPWYKGDKTNTIVFVSIDDIYGNKANAKSWDNKISSGGKTSIKHSFNKFAKRNFMRYKADETVKTNADGHVNVENNTLPEQSNIFTLNFAPSDNAMLGSTPFAYFPVYTTSDDGYSVVYNKNIQPRIAKGLEYEKRNEQGEKNKYKKLLFDETLHFGGNNGIINSFYSTYQFVIRRPITIEVPIILSEVDIYHFSTLDVIYLGGRYWMPIKVEIDRNGLSKFTLVVLPNQKNINNSELKEQMSQIRNNIISSIEKNISDQKQQ